MKPVLALLLVIGSVWALPHYPKTGNPCFASNCKIEEDCKCSSSSNPIVNPDDPAPQLIALTVSESIVKTLYDDYWAPLFFHRKNPDGSPIGLTFYVNHEYTDYELVQNLYLQGYEIGSHSITKNSSQQYWREATFNDLVEEFGGQRTIISHFANIPIEDVVGARTPQLQVEGDLSIDAYIQAGISYDNSWPTSYTDPIFPYTLDYDSKQRCLVTMTCPHESHPHFWVSPLTDIKGKNGTECNSLAACGETGTAQEISDWLVGQVDDVRNKNRMPLVLRLDSYWFSSVDTSLEGFTQFLDEMGRRNDVFFVAVKDVIDWVRHPEPLSSYSTPVYNRYASCSPVTCVLDFTHGSKRYMKSCVSCPKNYPWKGNPLGN